MKKKKLLTYLLLISGLASLTACSLFDDSDLKIDNHFDPIDYDDSSKIDENAVVAGGVAATEIDEVKNTYRFKSISYVSENNTIENTYKTGGVNENEFNVNRGDDYSATKKSNNYDLYVPKNLIKSEEQTVVLFIHGGAWVSGLKTDVNEYVYQLANKGYISATIKYSLLKRTMDDSTKSIFRNLDEIDACIKSIKSILGELGFDTSKLKLAIGGASSGAHLAMLYSFSRGSLSPIPISFIIDAVGPVDIKPSCWKRFIDSSDEVLDNGLSKSAIDIQIANSNLADLPVSGESYNWNDYQTMRIANGMCGLPYTLDEVRAATDENEVNITNPNSASTVMTKKGGGEDLLSVTYWMNSSNKFPIICAYAGQDTIVGINQFATLENSLINFGYEYEMFYFKNGGHTGISKEVDALTYNSFINQILDWCANK